MPAKKWWALFGAGALAVAASVAQFFPQTIGLSAPLSQLATGAKSAADNIPNTCPAELCADAGSGAIRPLDGGVRGICECG